MERPDNVQAATSGSAKVPRDLILGYLEAPRGLSEGRRKEGRVGTQAILKCRCARIAATVSIEGSHSETHFGFLVLARNHDSRYQHSSLRNRSSRDHL